MDIIKVIGNTVAWLSLGLLIGFGWVFPFVEIVKLFTTGD